MNRLANIPPIDKSLSAEARAGLRAVLENAERPGSLATLMIKTIRDENANQDLKANICVHLAHSI